MNITEAKQQLSRIFTIYPSYRDYLSGQPSGQATVDAWCEMLEPCEASDVIAVVDQIVSGTLEPVSRYEKPDRLPLNIRRSAMEIASKRATKQEQQNKYHQPQTPGALAKVRQWPTGRIAIWLGEQVKAGRITKAENDKRMKALMVWDKGGAEPEWLNEANVTCDLT